MTQNPEKQIIELSKLMRDDTMISTPLNGSTSDEWHDVVKMRDLIIRINKLLYQRYTKSRDHYLRSNDILFSPYPTLHKLNVGWSGVNNLRSKLLQISGSTSSKITFLCPHLPIDIQLLKGFLIFRAKKPITLENKGRGGGGFIMGSRLPNHDAKGRKGKTKTETTKRK